MADGEKKYSLLLIVSLVVSGLILAGGISYFIATRIVTDKAATQSTREPGTYIKLGDPKDGLIINVGGVNSGRFLKIGLVLEVKSDKNPDKNTASKEGKLPSSDEIRILDTVVHILRSQKIENFDPAKQDTLKTLIKDEVNESLGYEKVYAVYITNFVLQ
jgi:flagellar FliL protein